MAIKAQLIPGSGLLSVFDDAGDNSIISEPRRGR